MEKFSLKVSTLVIALMLVVSSMAQSSEAGVTGRVTDEQGVPLIGVSVVISGTSQGTSTDTEGRFTLSLGKRETAQLRITYVGMKPQTVAVTSSSVNLNIRMKSDASIEQVIVQGYGRVQRRENLIGSAFQVNAKDLEFKPATRIDNILDGMVPGLVIQPNTDAPGSTRTRYNTRIRGEASLSASNEPLWIIDGVPVYTGGGTNQIPGMSYSVSPLSFINPDDIESITVLKDASEVSIYGADGANGVILVTTKGGRFSAMPLRVKASFRYGVAAIDESTRLKMLNAKQYMAYAKEAWVNGGNDERLFPFQDNDMNSYSTTDTNWVDEFYGIGQNYMATISLESSSDRTTTRFSGSYYREQGTVRGNLQQRASSRLNNSFKITPKLTFTTNLAASYNINNLFSPSHEYYQVLPIYSPYNADGSFRLYNKHAIGIENGEIVWGRAKFHDNTIPKRELGDNTQKTFATDANFILSYTLVKGLTATAQFGANYQHSYETMYESRQTLPGIVNNVPRGYSKRSSANFLSWTNIERLNFNRSFGKHDVSALLGLEMSSKGYNTLYASGSGFMNDQTQEVGFSESASRSGYSSVSTTRKLSVFAQAGYMYDARYGVQFSFRREGNSSFGRFARFENYFSVGGTWNIHREKFFDSRIVNNLKIKGSFGTSGNSRVDNAQMRGFGIFTYGDSYSYNGIIGGVVSTPANPGLSWEMTYMTNIGIDIRLWDRLSIAVEGYFNKTENLLSKIYTSRVIGDERIYGNIGSLSNKGIEVTINSVNIKRPNFGWTTDLNMSHNTNRVLELSDGKSISYGSTITAVGHDSNSFYLIRWAGVDPSTGAPMWYDKDGNLTYDYSTSDRIIDKTSSPSLTGGMNNRFDFKNFSFSFMLNYTIGGYALCTLGSNGISDGYNIIDNNVSVNSLDHWQKPGDVAVHPRISTVSSDSGRPSTRFLYSRTNIRLQNLILSYSLPEEVSRKLKLSNLRVSFIADNLYLWTPDQKRNRNSYKTMMQGYPVQRTFSLSLDLTF